MQASLTRATLVEADLTDAVATGVQALRCDLSGAILRRANLQGGSLLGSVLDGADLSFAKLDETVLDPRSLAHVSGLEHVSGEWIEFASRGGEVRPSQPRSAASEWEATVGARLQAIPLVTATLSGFRTVDYVARTLDGSFIAIEAASSARSDLLRKASISDLVVVPDEEYREQLRATNRIVGSDLEPKIVPLSELEDANARGIERRRSLLGSHRVIERQAERLVPYLDLLERMLQDPSARSRISVNLETGADMMLTSADRTLLKRLPEISNGDYLRTAMTWAESHQKDLLSLRSAGNALRVGSGLGLKDPIAIAQRGLQLEADLLDAGFEVG